MSLTINCRQLTSLAIQMETEKEGSGVSLLYEGTDLSESQCIDIVSKIAYIINSNGKLKIVYYGKRRILDLYDV